MERKSNKRLDFRDNAENLLRIRFSQGLRGWSGYRSRIGMGASRYSVAVAVLITTACSEAVSESVESLGSGSAPGMAVEPLDTGCDDDVCHVLLRLNANSLEVLGYAFQGAEIAATSPAQARVVAQTLVNDNIDAQTDVELDEPDGGIYAAFAPPSDFGGFVLVGEETGVAVAAGGVVWAGKGTYWTPTKWHSASDMQLGSAAVTPGGRQGERGECAGVASAKDALDVALRSNLAVHLAKVGTFSSFSYLYTPAVGVLTDDGCEPSVAEYLIVMTQIR